MLTDLAEAARASGLEVVELPGWRTNHSSGGEDYKGVLCHHTGSYDEIGDTSSDLAYAKWLAFTGRDDLDPPLCNLALSAEGVVYVCAAGNANHAGQARATGPMPPASDGNALYIGIEAYNSGSQGWSGVQYSAYVRLCAALCTHYGWPASHVRAHRETSVTGKWDPGLLNMDRFRSDIATAMTAEEDWMNKQEREWLEEQFDTVRKDIAKVRKGAGNNRRLLMEKLQAEGIQQDRIEAIIKELEDSPQ